jgi:hypothetical protein
LTVLVPVMRISEEVFKTLNASKHAVEVPKVGGRMALYEGFHMVHCVVSISCVPFEVRPTY